MRRAGPRIKFGQAAEGNETAMFHSEPFASMGGADIADVPDAGGRAFAGQIDGWRLYTASGRGQRAVPSFTAANYRRNVVGEDAVGRREIA